MTNHYFVTSVPIVIIIVIVTVIATTYLVFCQLYFTSLKVDADWLAALQLFGGPGQPCVQFIQSVLELTQTQQSTLQLMLKTAQEKHTCIFQFFKLEFFFQLDVFHTGL